MPMSAQAPLPTAPVWDYDVVERYPHDPKAFTQGLLCDPQGVLWESTGQRGQSTLRKLDLAQGAFKIVHSLSDKQFGEGLALSGGKFFWLTWDTQVCHVLDAKSLKPVAKFSYEGEGWGLCPDDQARLWMSNGSSKLVLRDPKNFRAIREVDVKNEQGQEVAYLNELEWVEGRIYANLWGTTKVAVIHPDTGLLEAYIDFAGLLSASESAQADVLNGIAYDSKSKRMWVTGKLWPRLFEVRVSR